MRELHFFVPGQPVGKGRPRVTTKGGMVRNYTPEKTRCYEATVAHEAHLAMAGAPLFDGPVGMVITAFMQTPAKPSKALKAALLIDRAWHTGRPDGDNIIKAAADAMNGIVWRDDAQVARCSFAKKYAATPGLHIYVEAL
jgi:Holliday junction resolvase RusA-like endonuclease